MIKERKRWKDIALSMMFSSKDLGVEICKPLGNMHEVLRPTKISKRRKKETWFQEEDDHEARKDVQEGCQKELPRKKYQKDRLSYICKICKND